MGLFLCVRFVHRVGHPHPQRDFTGIERHNFVHVRIHKMVAVTACGVTPWDRVVVEHIFKVFFFHFVPSVLGEVGSGHVFTSGA